MDHEHHEHGQAEPAPAAENAVPVDAAAVIEQVRELLFGDHRRATEATLKSLEDRIAALTATVEARLADLDRRLGENRAEAEHARDAHVEAIGSALGEIGERLKGLIAKPQG